MSRAVLILANDTIRAKAQHWLSIAEPGTRIEFKRPKRTIPQNDRMWAMLTDVAGQVLWHGVRLTPDDWKLIFLDALKSEMRLVPNLNGNGFINLGRSSSDLSKDEFGELMELIEAFGAQHSVTFHDTKSEAA